jgi:Xaa-Pro aminopeptidase
VAIYSEFPESEYADRHRRLLSLAAKEDIEAFIFTDELNLRYFAGGPLTDIWVCRNDFVVLILPVDPSREPSLLLNKARQGAAKPSWIRDQRFWMASVDAADSNEALRMIITAMRESGIGQGKLAMEIGMYETLFMPILLFQELKRTFPKAQIVSAHDLVMQVQAVKSAPEIAALKTACAISADAIEKGFASMKEGMTEIEISNVIKSEMFRLGAGSIPFLTVIAGWEGRSICCDSHPTAYSIKKGDVVQVDGGCSYKGYCADMCRTGALGFVKQKRYEELYEASVGAQAAVRGKLGPGRKIAEVCNAGRDYFIDQGYGELLVFGVGQTGHGIGLDLHQPPFLLYESQEVLEAGMTLAIEPTISEHPNWDDSSYFTIVENNYVITPHGYEKMTNSGEAIRIV